MGSLEFPVYSVGMGMGMGTVLFKSGSEVNLEEFLFFAEAFEIGKGERVPTSHGRRQTSALTPHLSPAPRRPA